MTAAGLKPLLYLDSERVVELCGTIDPLEVVTEAFLAVAAGTAAVTPEAALRWTAPDGTGARSLILPAWYGDVYGCKIINACIGNPARGLPRAHGLIVLNDLETAAPVCVMEGGHISALRTAAVSVAALRAVRADISSVAFLGCGRQAGTHLDLLAARTDLTTVTVHDVDPARAAAFAEDVRRSLPDVAVELAASARDAVRAAEVTIAVTTTTTAYVEADWLGEGAVFVNVSLDDATEDLLLGCDHLVIDDWQLVSEDDTRLLGRLAQAGRVVGPADEPADGVRRVDTDLATLLSGRYPRRIAETDRVVINPFGMGVHDIALASRVYQAALERSAGLSLPR